MMFYTDICNCHEKHDECNMICIPFRRPSVNNQFSVQSWYCLLFFDLYRLFWNFGSSMLFNFVIVWLNKYFDMSVTGESYVDETRVWRTKL